MAELNDAYSGRHLNGDGEFIDHNQESWNELLDERPGPTWLEQQRNQNVVRPPSVQSNQITEIIDHHQATLIQLLDDRPGPTWLEQQRNRNEINENVIDQEFLQELRDNPPSMLLFPDELAELRNRNQNEINGQTIIRTNNLNLEEQLNSNLPGQVQESNISLLPTQEHIAEQTQNHLPSHVPSNQNEVPNKVLEAAENRKRKGCLGFLDKMVYILSNKEKISENVPKTVSDIKMMLSDFSKIKNELMQLETKIREKEMEFIKTKKELETMKNKFNELIAITDDQELVEMLNKKNENNPLIVKNKTLEEELNELKKEYTVLKEIVDNFNEVCPKNICKICYENDLEVFLNNCGHTFCGGCTNNIKECPTCKQKVFNVGKLYYLT